MQWIILLFRWRGKVRISPRSDVSIDSSFEGYNRIYPNTVFGGHLGLGSYISYNCNLHARVGRFCSIAPGVCDMNSRHPFSYPFVSSSPLFYSTKKQCGHTFAKTTLFSELAFADKDNSLGVVIENDVWIGQNVLLVGGICIKTGAVVLAGAVVTKDVPPYAVVGGVPAKIIKYRYTEEDISFLLKTKWWEKDEEWFKTRWELFSDMDIFRERMSL